ncbi:unnamed protein product [Owenia fusiformis]|uniref:Uncharacterized protein n=1 Tax=Owenia fusiformis TaxID=6347 RepID=A0A8J1TZY4_OWEFU|nr:unnamed protein product [Owenia fusiformis]
MFNFTDLRHFFDYSDYELIEGNITDFSPYYHTEQPTVDMSTNKYLIGFGSALVAWVIISNLTVIISVLTSRRFSDQPMKLFIVNLSLSDVLVGLLVIPFALHTQVAESWKLGLVACRVWIFLDWLCGCLSMYGLLMLNLDRFIFALRPVKYNHWMSLKSHCAVVVMLLLPWLTSAIVAIPLTTDAESARIDHIQSLQVCTSGSSPVFMIGSSAALFFLPMTLVLGMSLVTMLVAFISHSNRYTENIDGGIQQSFRKAKSTSVAMLIVNLVYLVMWCPYFSLLVILGLSDGCSEACPDPLLFHVMYWIGYSNAGINPILWLMFGDVRQCVKRVLCCKSCKKNDSRTELVMANSPKSAMLNDYTAMENSSSTETVANNFNESPKEKLVDKSSY